MKGKRAPNPRRPGTQDAHMAGESLLASAAAAAADADAEAEELEARATSRWRRPNAAPDAPQRRASSDAFENKQSARHGSNRRRTAPASSLAEAAAEVAAELGSNSSRSPPEKQ